MATSTPVPTQTKPAPVVIPDVVLFKAFGRVLPALVLAHRFGEVSHLGSHGEPLLTLAVIDPARESGLDKDKDGNFVYPVGRIPQVFTEHDVVHVSHLFSDEFKKKKAIQSPADVAAQRGHGEWSEFVGDNDELVDRLRRNLGEATAEALKQSDQSNRQRARAELAEFKLADANNQIDKQGKIIAKLQSDTIAAAMTKPAAFPGATATEGQSASGSEAPKQ